jgi:hypothetical protein
LAKRLFGLFTGARLEEIAQLEVTDVTNLNGFHAFLTTTEAQTALGRKPEV